MGAFAAVQVARLGQLGGERGRLGPWMAAATAPLFFFFFWLAPGICTSSFDASHHVGRCSSRIAGSGNNDNNPPPFPRAVCSVVFLFLPQRSITSLFPVVGDIGFRTAVVGCTMMVLGGPPQKEFPQEMMALPSGPWGKGRNLPRALASGWPWLRIDGRTLRYNHESKLEYPCPSAQTLLRAVGPLFSPALDYSVGVRWQKTTNILSAA